MSTKNILLVLFTLVSLSTYAQVDKNKDSENKDIVTEFTQNRFSVKARKLADLKTYNWSILKDIYKNKASDSDLEITVHYDENGTFELIDGNDLFQQIKCKIYNINSTINQLQVFSNKL